MHCLFSLKSLLTPKSDYNSGQKQPVPAHLTQSKTLRGPCCCGPQPSLPALLHYSPPRPLALFPPASHASKFSSNRRGMFLPQEFCTCCFLCQGYFSSGEPCGCSLKTVTSGPEMHWQMHCTPYQSTQASPHLHPATLPCWIVLHGTVTTRHHLITLSLSLPHPSFLPAITICPPTEYELHQNEDMLYSVHVCA